MLKPILYAFAALIISGCATVSPEKVDERDPLQSINRTVYDFNMDVLDAYILKPVAEGYLAVTNDPVRKSV